MAVKNRCSCGQALEKKVLHQATNARGRGTFMMAGRRVRVAGKRLVCKTHGTQKVIYN